MAAWTGALRGQPGTSLHAREVSPRTARPLDKLRYEESLPNVLSILSTGTTTPDIGLTPKWEYRRMCCTSLSHKAWLYQLVFASRPSVPNRAFETSVGCDRQEPSVFLGNFTRFLEGTRALGLQAAEVALDFPDIEIKVLPDEIRIFAGSVRIARNEWPRRREAGLCGSWRRRNRLQNYSRLTQKQTQPAVSQTPYSLDRIHAPCLMGA